MPRPRYGQGEQQRREAHGKVGEPLMTAGERTHARLDLRSISAKPALIAFRAYSVAERGALLHPCQGWFRDEKMLPRSRSEIVQQA